jgi:hypothetical protein
VNVKQIDLNAEKHKAEITITYGSGQQINVVTSHPDMSTAAAMASLQAIKKMKGIIDKEVFENSQKEQDKQFDVFMNPLPTMIDKN